MQRIKASVSVEVKQVIGALCRLLAATGLDSVPEPETFRRAKFSGGPEVAGQFWKLLATILQRTGIVFSDDSSQLRGDSEHRKLVAAGLWQTGYRADWMCGREAGEDEEGKSLSSRDLLLALGWLLAKGTLEKLLTQRVQQLDKTLLTSLPVNTQVSHELQLDLTSLRRLQWLVGYLRHQRRILLSMIEERAQLLHAVLSAGLPSAVSSSSDSSSKALQDDCVCMRHLCDLLETYLNWKQVEKVFWTWMDSVVDCHLTESVVKTSVHSPHVCHHQELEDMLSRLPTAQKGPRRCKEDNEDRRGERLQEGLDTSSLLCHPSQAYRVRLQVERPVSDHISTAERLHDSTKAPDMLPASQAAQLLLKTEALLLERRDRQRRANRMQLQETIGELEGLVLIPP
ncbi:tubulin epsilon and delta complex protein 1 [Platichthys flesus]|uniref:tubulin epsilon and delta complex protein 1 n=1 Tax=Platichthys flesus TaxID=8260 RepID=UPI002DBB4F6E|nr:tubulin epsilon and delta complex protein 1 [Platichthys flesus]